MTAAFDVCAIALYLDDVIAALRGRGISVETGFVSASQRAGRSLTIVLGHGRTSLSHATLSWQPIIGWSLTSLQRRPRQWVLPLAVQADPAAIAEAIRELTASLRTSIAASN